MVLVPLTEDAYEKRYPVLVKRMMQSLHSEKGGPQGRLLSGRAPFGWQMPPTGRNRSWIGRKISHDCHLAALKNGASVTCDNYAAVSTHSTVILKQNYVALAPRILFFTSRIENIHKINNHQ
jgi:hypothetical protein